MRKLIAISDIHLHFWKAFSGGHGTAGSRFTNTLKVVRASLERARELKCPWVCAGDWVHTIGWAHNGVLSHWIALLNLFPDVEKITVWGNHDARSHGGEILEHETVVQILAESVECLVLLDGQDFVASNGLRFYGEGYQPDRKFHEFLSWPKGTSYADVGVGVFHQTVNNSQLPSGSVLRNETSGLEVEELTDLFRLSIVGDIHHPQRFSPDQRKNVVLVPGSPEHHNFGDTGDHGFWECTIAPEYVTCELHEGGSPKFITVDEASDVKADGNFYRVLKPCSSSELPANATVIASPPVEVKERNIIKEGASPREILEAWLKVDPPENPEGYLDLGEQLLSGEGLGSIRKVVLLRATIKNFMCFESAEFNIVPGVNLVMGQARDFESNGAGKTTLFESIFWALFGRTTKGVSAEDVVRRTADECVVELQFYDSSTSSYIVVERSRKKGGSGSLKVADKQGMWQGNSADLTKDLQAYLGTTPDLFQALSYFSQSKLLLFSQATDSERKTMLSDLCGLEGFQKASAAARTQCQELETVLFRIEADSRAAAGQRSMVDLSLKEYLFRQEEQKVACERDLLQIEKELESIDREKGALPMMYSAKIQEVENEFSPQFSEIDGSKQQAEELLREGIKQSILKINTTWVVDTKDLTPGDKNEYIQLREETRKKLIELDTRLNTVRDLAFRAGFEVDLTTAQIKKIQNQGLECFECGQPITAASKEANLDILSKKLVEQARDRQEALQLYAELSKERELLSAHEILASKRIDQIEKYEERTRTRDLMLEQEFARMERISLEAEAMVAKRRSVVQDQYSRKKISVEAEATSRAQYLESTRTALESRRASIANAADQFQPLISKAENQKADLSARIKDLEDHRRMHEKKKQILSYWIKGLSRSGVQSLLLEGVAGAFNELRGIIFPILTNGVYDVQFATQSRNADGEAREKTDFIIRDRGALVSYESLSGGQRRRIDLGVMLTLALAVSKIHQVPGVLGMLILDEVFGFLDRDGVESLHTALLEMYPRITSIYAITHDVDLQSLFSQTLLVSQDEFGVSTLREMPSTGE